MGETFSDILHKQKQRSRRKVLHGKRREGKRGGDGAPSEGLQRSEAQPRPPDAAEARGRARAVPLPQGAWRTSANLANHASLPPLT